MELRPYAIINMNKERGPPCRKALSNLISYIGQSLTRIEVEAEAELTRFVPRYDFLHISPLNRVIHLLEINLKQDKLFFFSHNIIDHFTINKNVI